jgi:ABC-type glycerol-3-phosphate transport system permease component
MMFTNDGQEETMMTQTVLTPASSNSSSFRWTRWTKRTILFIFLLIIAILSLFPIILVLLGSFKTNQELTGGATIWPKIWQFTNYSQAWKTANFSGFTLNSIFVSIATTVGTLLVSSMAAYAVDRVNFKGKKAYTLLMASTLFISIGAVVLRPQFDLMVKLGLNNSLWGHHHINQCPCGHLFYSRRVL